LAVVGQIAIGRPERWVREEEALYAFYAEIFASTSYATASGEGADIAAKDKLGESSWEKVVGKVHELHLQR
jgi:hypothetical protein